MFVRVACATAGLTVTRADGRVFRGGGGFSGLRLFHSLYHTSHSLWLAQEWGN